MNIATHSCLNILLTLSLTACFNTVRSTAVVEAKAIQTLQAFDYVDWTFILSQHVDEQGRVDYDALKKGRGPLDRFVATIGIVGPTTRPDLFRTRDEQLAYYINAYNALTMFNIINRMPEIESVNDDLKSFFYFTEFELDGSVISLYGLENEIIRPRYDEPRSHFALNCASAGCPTLPAKPFLPHTLEAQLSEETSRFLHDVRNIKVEGNTITLSQIFEWYAEDFRPSPVAWIRLQTIDIELPDSPIIKHRPYDWTMNRQPPK